MTTTPDPTNGPPTLDDGLRARLRGALTQLNAVVMGKEEVIQDAMTAVLAGGHILLEDVPGVGKTTLARAIAQVLGCSFKRVQFTSDLLPSDVIGVHVYRRSDDTFDFRPGPIFANLVLADEVNRTTPKTQSSLLEAMNEGQVSIGQDTHVLPKPFLVIATQNPQDFKGTYPLPESQLDRFMVRLRLGYADPSVERNILRGARRLAIEDVKPVLSTDELIQLSALVDTVRVDDIILDYLMAIVEETRRSPALLLGVSTRGALALQRAAQARALLLERDYVIPDDVKHLAVPVLAHRVHTGGHVSQMTSASERVISELIMAIEVPL